MKFAAVVFALAAASMASAEKMASYPISLGPRPYWLVDQMRDGPLKEKLRKYIV